MAETYTVRLSDGRGFGPADVGVIRAWAAQGRVPADAKLEPTGGGEAIVAGEHPELAGAINAPPTVAGAVVYDTGTDATGGLIPYRNPKALVGYYVGIASLLGVVLWGVGILISVPALVLGILGLRARKRDPRVRGAGHAWTAIIIGAIMTLGHLAFIGLIIYAIVTGD